MPALNTFVEHGLTLIRTSHLSCHVVHLLAFTLGTILINDDLLWPFRIFVSLFCGLHPLLSLIELLASDYLIAD